MQCLTVWLSVFDTNLSCFADSGGYGSYDAGRLAVSCLESLVDVGCHLILPCFVGLPHGNEEAVKMNPWSNSGGGFWCSWPKLNHQIGWLHKHPLNKNHKEHHKQRQPTPRNQPNHKHKPTITRHQWVDFQVSTLNFCWQTKRFWRHLGLRRWGVVGNVEVWRFGGWSKSQQGRVT